MTVLGAPQVDYAATFDGDSEFDRQVEILLALDYPRLIGMNPIALRAMLEPLRDAALDRCRGLSPPTRSCVPFLLVVSRLIASPSMTVTLTTLNGRPGFVSQDTADIDRFEPIASIGIPAGDAYLALDVDRGAETLNATPDQALARFTEQGRSPMTIDEGIAFITHFPESLEKNNCFQLAGSRCGDRRVPGLWISKRAPKLGFCWAGNRHTWLGMASCASRAGIV